MMGLFPSKLSLKPAAPLECKTLSDGMIECKKGEPRSIELQIDIKLPIIFREKLDGSFVSQDMDKLIASKSATLGNIVNLNLRNKLLRCRVIMRDPSGCAQLLHNPGLPFSEIKMNALTPVITGPSVWEMLHCVPHICDRRLATEDIIKFVKRIGRNLTCSKCQEHFASNVKNNPVEYLYGPEHLEVWICNLHNECNEINGKEKWEIERTRKYYRNVAKSIWRRAVLNYLYFTFSVPGRQSDYEAILESLCLISPPNLDLTILMKKFKPADKDNIRKIHQEIESKLDSKTEWSLSDREAMVRAAIV